MGGKDRDVWWLLKSELLKLRLSSELPRKLKIEASRVGSGADICGFQSSWLILISGKAGPTGLWATVNEG